MKSFFHTIVFFSQSIKLQQNIYFRRKSPSGHSL